MSGDTFTSPGGTRATDLTVLLPCSGEGRRFGAPYPKELHRVSRGQSLIDLALAPIIDLTRRGARVRAVVTLTSRKLATADYLSAAYGEQLELVFTFQGPQHGSEMPGALRAAEPLCVGPVVLLLSDQQFGWVPEENPVHQALMHVSTEPWAVVAAWTEDPQMLRTEGALRIDAARSPARVVLAAEKPSDPSGYNAVWAAVACAEGRAGQLPGLLEQGGSNPMCGAPAVLVKGYRNVSFPEQVPVSIT